MRLLPDKCRHSVLGFLLLLALLMGSGHGLAQGWPRAFHNADGSVTQIPAPPGRILSTSVSVTGTLLAIDAPVVASATAVNGQFFGQWDKVAEQRHIAKVWPAGSIDLELAYAMAPDLIVVSINGADSSRAYLAELRAIAPVIIVNYGNQTWQALARELGAALGLEAQVEQRIGGFDALLTNARQQIHLPDGQANIINFNGPGTVNPVATPASVHARLLESLGFSIEAPNPAWQSNLTRSGDFIWAEYENLTQLTAGTTFLLSAGDVRINEFLHDPLLQRLPSVQQHRVYSLGAHAFRVDYYSASEMVADIVRHFAGSPTQER
ncbi:MULTISPECIES: Fe2+-enterobactin ABC transporter substrate-binding protein [Serratia]|uniref:Fe2+-enterobactin ABC transporter substrate-binding protein n=1 Tax=Serratia fonticola TaxID=47917 RepID=A0AAW3WTY8_SERFO|nr:Fe2+-enterobactin ABC transporter substrate-binding protein [Serratia fonticola]MBC3214195.1 Fe2+-enterobactin ABC transporter substrate-binding protein [Serratia fonticola]NYA15118.1 Fe2+-enterobactin ABC transporter substrate-binding protein [Serratia fonticola]NYA34947.1 Fe2+-enterobactin ABC transporter substrate-binding protein [Serratia fonticola]NYA46028.1 Fe2+-enterobactin ABC transporter substrate-binding protein [Serratia fonticola]